MTSEKSYKLSARRNGVGVAIIAIPILQSYKGEYKVQPFYKAISSKHSLYSKKNNQHIHSELKSKAQYNSEIKRRVYMCYYARRK